MRKYFVVCIVILLFSFNLYTPLSVWTPILFNVFVLICCFLQEGKLKLLTCFQKNILLLALLLFIFSIFTSIANSYFSAYVYGRLFRIIINTVLLALVVRNIRVDMTICTTALSITLFLHVLSIYLQFIFPDLKPLFYSLLVTEKEFVAFDLRSFGLFSSYDSSGLCLCFTLTLFYCLFLYKSKVIYIVCFIITFLAAFLISRYTMVVACLLFLCMMYIIFVKRRMLFYTVLTPLLILFISISYLLFCEYFVYGDIRVEESYGNSTDILLNDMIVIPTEIMSFVIGTGESIANSDIGYIKLIFMHGILGLSLVLIIHLYVLRYLKNKLDVNKLCDVISFKYIYIVLGLLLLFNCKLLLLYSRGFNDFFFLLAFLLEYNFSINDIYYEKNKISYL